MYRPTNTTNSDRRIRSRTRTIHRGSPASPPKWMSCQMQRGSRRDLWGSIMQLILACNLTGQDTRGIGAMPRHSFHPCRTLQAAGRVAESYQIQYMNFVRASSSDWPEYCPFPPADAGLNDKKKRNAGKRWEKQAAEFVVSRQDMDLHHYIMNVRPHSSFALQRWACFGSGKLDCCTSLIFAPAKEWSRYCCRGCKL